MFHSEVAKKILKESLKNISIAQNNLNNYAFKNKKEFDLFIEKANNSPKIISVGADCTYIGPNEGDEDFEFDHKNDESYSYNISLKDIEDWIEKNNINKDTFRITMINKMIFLEGETIHNIPLTQSETRSCEYDLNHVLALSKELKYFNEMKKYIEGKL